MDAVTYTGKVGESVKKQDFDLKVEPGSTELIDMEVTFEEYFGKLIDQVRFGLILIFLRITKHPLHFSS